MHSFHVAGKGAPVSQHCLGSEAANHSMCLPLALHNLLWCSLPPMPAAPTNDVPHNGLTHVCCP